MKVAGLLGAILGLGLATVIVYPLCARLAHRYGAWDPRNDVLLAAIAVVFGGLALWLNWSELAGLGELG